MWDSKKVKGYKDQVPWPGAKKHPTKTFYDVNLIKIMKIKQD